MTPNDDIDEYIETHLSKYDTSHYEDTELGRRVRAFLATGLKRLNDVTAGDPFWVGTNRRPTIFKLQPYFSTVLTGDPEDDEARWILIAVALDACDNSFGQELIGPLVLRDPNQVRWLVGAAEWVLTASGVDTTEWLRQSLGRLTLVNPLQGERFEQIIMEGDQMTSRAAGIALAVSAGATLRDCRGVYPLPRA